VFFLRDQSPSPSERHPARLRSLEVATGVVRGPWPASEYTFAAERLYLSIPRKVQILDARSGRVRILRADRPEEDDFGGEIYAEPEVSPDERWLLVSVSHPGSSALLLAEIATGVWSTHLPTKH
jgi:hypothetical protein